MEDVKIVKQERKKTFDAIRAMATIAVFVFHAGYLLPFSDSSVTNLFSASTFINLHKLVYICGTVGVCTFFVLSGFLLFYQMYKKMEALSKDSLKDYFKKRLLRILPLYYFSIFFIVIFFRSDILIADGGIKTIVYNLLFARELHSDGATKITINPVYWSLIIEMHFYFILPIFYYFFYKKQHVFWFGVLAFLGILYRTCLVVFSSLPTMQFLRLTPANLDFFAFGMLGAYMYIRYGSKLQFLGRKNFQIVWFLLFIIFIYFYNLEFVPSLAYVFMPPFFGLVASVWILSFLLNEESSLVRSFTCKPVLFIARISFSIYIWHFIVLDKVENFGISNISKFILSIIITLVFSTVTYYLVEAPFLKLKQKKPVVIV